VSHIAAVYFGERVVAKKRSGHYLPGRRGWIKTKNRAYWRYPLEVEAARLVGGSLRGVAS
jgi:ATP-dependent DNA ligase